MEKHKTRAAGGMENWREKEWVESEGRKPEAGRRKQGKVS
jgi:hypothetical protein